MKLLSLFRIIGTCLAKLFAANFSSLPAENRVPSITPVLTKMRPLIFHQKTIRHSPADYRFLTKPKSISFIIKALTCSQYPKKPSRTGIKYFWNNRGVYNWVSFFWTCRRTISSINVNMGSDLTAQLMIYCLWSSVSEQYGRSKLILLNMPKALWMLFSAKQIIIIRTVSRKRISSWTEVFEWCLMSPLLPSKSKEESSRYEFH